MTAKSVTAIQLLAKLKPTRTILGVCVVASKTEQQQQQQPRQWHIGTSISDPYLSHASAMPPHLLWASSSPPPIAALVALAKAECAEAVVLGLPVEDGNGDTEAGARRDELLQHLLQSPDATVMISVSDVAPATSAHVAEEYTKNILWDSLPVPDLQLLQHPTSTASVATDQACLHAGIALQMWLDEHCGGWANTFG